MRHIYTPEGVCSKQMIIDIDENTNIISNIEIVGGCPGNTVGLTKVLKGMSVDEVIKLLKGTPCGYRGTSCPDQIAIALEEIKNKK